MIEDIDLVPKISRWSTLKNNSFDYEEPYSDFLQALFSSNSRLGLYKMTNYVFEAYFVNGKTSICLDIKVHAI